MENIEVITTKAQKAIAIREKVKVDQIPQVMGRLFGELVSLLGNDVQCVGPPFVLYHSWSQDEVDLDVGFPVAGEGITAGKVRPIELPSVRAAVAVHTGPYDKLVGTYNEMMVWMKQKGLVPADYMWEEYLNSPDDTPPEKLMTKLYWPLK